MIAPATTTAAATAAASAPPDAFAAPSSSSGAANASDAFAALLDGLASTDGGGDAASDDTAALPPPTFSGRFGTDTAVAARARSARPSSTTQSDADEQLAGQKTHADERAASASMASLVAAIMISAPLPAPTDPVAVPAPQQAAATAPEAVSGVAAPVAGSPVDPSLDRANDVAPDGRFDPDSTSAPTRLAQGRTPLDQAVPGGSTLERNPEAKAGTKAGTKALADATTAVNEAASGAAATEVPALPLPTSPTGVQAAPQPSISAAVGAKGTSRQKPPALSSSLEHDAVQKQLDAAAANRIGPEAQTLPRPASDASAAQRSGSIDTHRNSAAPTAPPDQAPATPPLSGQSGSSSSDSAASWSRPGNDASTQAARSDRPAQSFVHAVDAHMVAASVAPAPAAGVGARLSSSTIGAVSDIAVASAAVPDDVASQIVQGARLQWSDGIGQARITLKPEYLGGVTVALHLDQGSVTAVLHADSPAVRSWLESNESTLRQGLSDQGLKLERLVVAEAAPGEEGAAPQDQSSSQRERPRRERRRSAADGTFEIIL
jgi:flagellar hook-length control protein FliK